jgi:hypothetical protein
MLPVAEAAFVPVSVALKVTVPPFAIFVADEATASVDAPGPVTVVFVAALLPQPMDKAEIPAIKSSTAQLIRLRRPGSQIISIDARLTTAPAAIIPAPDLLCAEPVDEGPSVVTVRVDCKGPAPIAAIDGENEQVTPAGKLPQLNDTSPV